MEEYLTISVGTSKDQAENHQEQDGGGNFSEGYSLLFAHGTWTALQVVRRGRMAGTNREPDDRRRFNPHAEELSLE